MPTRKKTYLAHILASVVLSIVSNTLSAQEYDTYRPLIEGPDSVMPGSPVQLRVKTDHLTDWKTSVVNWTFPDGRTTQGTIVDFIVKTPGYHSVHCKILGSWSNGNKDSLCISRKVFCTSSGHVISRYPHINLNKLLFGEAQSQFMKNRRLVIAQSEQPLPEDDALFTLSGLRIDEIKTGSSYQYVVTGSGSPEELIRSYAVLYNLGLSGMEIRQFNETQLDSNHCRTIEPVKTQEDSPGKKTLKTLKEYPVSSLFRIVLDSSQTRIPFNDPTFSKVTVEITELKAGEGFEYSIMPVPDYSELKPVLSEVKEAGFEGAFIDTISKKELAERTVRKGHYIKPGDAENLNIEFSGLSDIKFEYNSAEISKESYANLDYIAAILKLENDFTLKIAAHTCNIGSPGYNMKLSQARAHAVIQYIVKKGIDRQRLFAEGFGHTNPVAPNTTEQSKALNRRVEFVIVFETKKQN